MVFDKAWFERNQSWLVKYANTGLGRHTLRISGGQSSIKNNKVVGLLPNALIWKHGGQIVAEFRTHDKFGKRLFSAFKPLWYTLHAWDLLTRPVPVFNLGFDTLTSYPDANPETNTVDGRVTRNGVDEAFTTIRSGAGVESDDSTASMNIVQIVASTTSNQYSNISRGVFLFDTSSLPDSASISSATFSFYREGSNDTLTASSSANSSIELVSSTPASNTALVAADYGQIGGTSFGSSAIEASLVNSQYNDIPLNSDGIAAISKTGVSKFGTRYKWDLNNTTTGITWASGGEIRSQISYADTAGTSQDPKLLVVFSPSGNYGFFM